MTKYFGIAGLLLVVAFVAACDLGFNVTNDMGDKTDTTMGKTGDRCNSDDDCLSRDCNDEKGICR